MPPPARHQIRRRTEKEKVHIRTHGPVCEKIYVGGGLADLCARILVPIVGIQTGVTAKTCYSKNVFARLVQISTIAFKPPLLDSDLLAAV